MRHRHHTIRGATLTRLAAMVAVLGLLAAGCGSGDGGPTDVAAGADDAAADTGTDDDAGDAAAGDDDAGGGDQVTLRFSWWGSDSRHEATQEVIDAFEEQNPNITIEGEFTGWDDYWDRLATVVAGGDTPDIMQQESRYVREYAERGALLDLSEVEDTIDLSALDEMVLPTGAVGDARWAIPTGVNVLSLVADPQIFEDAGVDMPDDTSWTWDDFLETTSAITEGTEDGVYGTQDKGFNEADFDIFARQRGESLYSEDGGLGFSVDTLAEWWEIGVQMRGAGAPEASRAIEIEAGGVDQSLLATNKGATGFWWSNELSALEEASGRTLELWRYPGESTHEQPGMYLKPAMFYSIGANTAHPEEAAMFLDFLVNSPEAAEIILSDRGLHVNLDRRAELEPDLSETDQKVADFLEELAPELADPPPLPPIGAGEVQSIMQRLNEQVLFDQLTPQEAAEQFMSEAEGAIG